MNNLRVCLILFSVLPGFPSGIWKLLCKALCKTVQAWNQFLIVMNYPLSLTMFLILKFEFYYQIVIQLLSLPLNQQQHSISSSIFYFEPVSLYLKYVYCRQHIVLLFILYDSFCISIGMFRSFTFSVILKSTILLLVFLICPFYSLHCFSSFLDFFWII